MSAMRFNSTNPDRWTQPRPHRDASLRYQMHGPIQPMDQELGILRRAVPACNLIRRASSDKSALQAMPRSPPPSCGACAGASCRHKAARGEACAVLSQIARSPSLQVWRMVRSGCPAHSSSLASSALP